MAEQCKAGVGLPKYGPCPVCGATVDEQCRGRNYAEMMARAQTLADAKARERAEKDLADKYQRQIDRRKSQS